MIRAATSGDAKAIAGIYNPYVAETIITFEEQPVSAQEVEQRISQVLADGLPYLVAELEGQVCGTPTRRPGVCVRRIGSRQRRPCI